MKMKRISNYRDELLGIPVTISHVMVDPEFDMPLINYERLTAHVLKELANARRRLTGSEIRFIRSHFGFTLAAFAERLGYTHPAVKTWEDRRDKATKMAWSTEKDIRLFILQQLQRAPAEIMALYDALAQGGEFPALDSPPALQVDGTIALPSQAWVVCEQEPINPTLEAPRRKKTPHGEPNERTLAYAA